jgi:hypothetical protein
MDRERDAVIRSIGFTGTRQGLTRLQSLALAAVLTEYSEIRECHHGDAVGADEAFHALAIHLRWRVILHPGCPEGHRDRSKVNGEACRQVKPPLERNRDIVDECEVLVACPGGMAEEKRSGTWATIRAARKERRPIVLVWPDGTVTRENGRE